MLQEAKDLQLRAVTELVTKTPTKKELTFRAPTGSGKTRMMADFMNRILTQHNDVVFLVSTLSKGGLAQQNFNVFKECADNHIFPNINPYLISTDSSGEESLFIPCEHNVYVLARDLYKKNGKLMEGPMENFLSTVTKDFFGLGMKKKIYLIKDECHQATNNLDAISENFFTKIFNFSATPKLNRGQIPDVQITDDEAVRAKLIKHIELNEDETIPVNVAIEKLMEVKGQYINLLGVNPCLIIQISNKDKAEQEWNDKIKPVLNKHQELKWMKITDKAKECDTNDSIKKKLAVERWKDYAKSKESLIDVIVFKMVISEGWDIPRACMLYQIRDTKSKQLDEQVVGRVRRNPRLLDFETLTSEAQELAMTAWVWGLKPESMNRVYNVSLWNNDNNINLTNYIRIRTTRLKNLTEKKGFNINTFIKPHTKPTTTDIFTLYRKLSQIDNDIQDLCYEYANDDINRWWTFMEQIDAVKKEYDSYICDYEESMLEDEEVSFPVKSSYIDNGNKNEIPDWVWKNNGKSVTFSFDSEAERKWAWELQNCARKFGDKIIYTDTFNNQDERFLWGKNFLPNSDIKYQYYNNGLHFSYPDFILKDKYKRIHLFEVKSVNKSKDQNFDKQEYYQKIAILKQCYLACSKLLDNHLFYLPILDGEDWKITCISKGNEQQLTIEGFYKIINKETFQ